MFRTVDALILREVRFRESDRILTALTAGKGRLTLSAHGALSKKSRIAAATQQLTFSELTLFEKNGRYSVREGVVKEGFSGLRRDLESFALASFFCECLELFAGEEQPEPELMQLGLNCLYALSENLGSCEKVKAAFELRLTAIEGYAPLTEGCAVCGRRDIREPRFQPETGALVCRECRKTGRALALTPAGVDVMRHVLGAPAKRILAFQLPEDDLRLLCGASEEWLLHCADRRLPTLEYYNTIRRGEATRET